MVVATVLVVWIAVSDLCLRSNFAILYVAPLLILAHADDVRRVWRAACVMMLLTFGVYFLKNVVNPPPIEWSHFDSRLVNRAFVALVLLAITGMLQAWMAWRREQVDPEVSDEVRHEDQQISATLALLTCAPLVVLIWSVDYFAPATYNLAILYAIPLFICGWMRSRRLLWGMLALTSALSIMAYLWGAPSPQPIPDFGLERNRLLAIGGTAAVTIGLHYWIGESAKA